MMMGSLEEDVLAVARPPEEEMPEVVNDLDIEDEEVAIERREVYLSKVGVEIVQFCLHCNENFRSRKESSPLR
jgi:ubiquitin-like domain-containing CTD phosphatase 1